PPSAADWLSDTTQLVIARVPSLSIPPPRPAPPYSAIVLLPVTTTWSRFKVAVPEPLLIPPPSLPTEPDAPGFPPVTVRPEMLTTWPLGWETPVIARGGDVISKTRSRP